jgi:hypothetical protein
MHSDREYSMLTQFPTEQWDNHGKVPVAAVLVSIAELAVEADLTFTEDLDDLGSFRWVAVRVRSGTCYAFVQHGEAGTNGEVQVFADPGSADLRELAEALNISSTMIVPSTR